MLCCRSDELGSCVMSNWLVLLLLLLLLLLLTIKKGVVCVSF
jgi:hypothetical protein